MLHGRSIHREAHYVHRIGWLRAAVLGANDGLVSTASLIVGVAAAAEGAGSVLVAGVAGITAGAMAMAAGEYISVSSQADAEAADLAREGRELQVNPEPELRELTLIYEKRGLTPDLAAEVARVLTEKDALAAHARDELGLTETAEARPVEAAAASAATFAVGGIVPLVPVLLAPEGAVIPAVFATTLAGLAALGFLGARAGGARPIKATLRVVLCGVLAMAATAAVGTLFGVAV
jgi:VIT1/CCC1 family predicted Fe2+/Mn2+ transporter